MAKFDSAAFTAESLEWDFSGFGVQASGIVPEPKDQQIGKFLDDLKALYLTTQKELPSLPEDASAEQMLEGLSQVTGKQWVKLMSDVAGLFAELCSQQPSKTQLLALPMRWRIQFYGWIQSEVVNPEVVTGAGNVVAMSPRSAAAG